MPYTLLLLAAFIGSTLFSLDAHADKRVALIIGNSAYQHTPALKNPGNDAVDMATALKALNFSVIEGIDLDKIRLEAKIKEFARALAGSDLGLFFYSGHGIQVGGHNYIVPVDAKLEDAAALNFELVRLEFVQQIMEQTTRTNVIFLDACRDNPLVRNLARALGTRSTQIGQGSRRHGIRQRYARQLLDPTGQCRARRRRPQFTVHWRARTAHSFSRGGHLLDSHQRP